MCGIAGLFLQGESAEQTLARLSRMTGSMQHRGPDDEGCWLSGEMDAALGFRRLSIIDLETGNQPLLNEDGSVAVVCTGEIYNHRELRRELEAAGHRFRTHSDCEVIVHLYEERGVDCLARLNGMFALAIADTRRRRVLLARDAAGMKHLYFTRLRGALAFASEARALFVGGVAEPAPDWNALSSAVAFGIIASPETAFHGVERLQPGHYAVCDSAGWEQGAFWRPLFARERATGSLRACAEELETRLRGAVGTHMAADVPVGAFVSGGLDSSLVAVFAAQVSSRPLKTFSIRFPEAPAIDEGGFAALVASRIGSEHEEVEFRAHHLPSVLPGVIRAQEEPLVSSPAALIFALSKAAARSVKVVVGGEGADELFAGYPWLKAGWVYPLRRLVPRGMASAAAGWAASDGLNRLFRLSAAPDTAAADGEWLRQCSFGDVRNLLNPDLPLLPRLDGAVLRAPARILESCRDRLERRLSLDFTRRLSDAILLNADKTSMANSLEIRMPFLDRTVLEFALALPSRFKLRLRQEKAILHGLSRHLPPEIAARRKHGLSLPLNALGAPAMFSFVRDTLLDGPGGSVLFRRAGLERWLSQAFKVRRQRRVLWTLLNLKLWWDQFIEKR